MTLPAAPMSVVEEEVAAGHRPVQRHACSTSCCGWSAGSSRWLAGVLTALLDLLLATVRVGGQLIGVSVLLAIGANSR